MVTFVTKPSQDEIKETILRDCGEKVRGDPMLDDFAWIGALMTNGNLCLHYLGQLNDQLVAYATQHKVLKEMGKFSLSKTKKLKSTGTSRDDDGTEFTVHKHHKVLTGYLEAWEAKNGFNTGNTGDLLQAGTNALPAAPPTLAGFVQPSDFRRYLFRYAYHWKDSGVGWKHGEFTHRLHWYIVVEHALHTNALKNKPVDLFRACAADKWIHEKSAGTGVWDNLFDQFKSPTCQDFRSAEILHAFLKDAAASEHPDHKKIWFLSQLIAGRAAKRLGQSQQRANMVKRVDVPGVAPGADGENMIIWKPTI